MPYDKLSKKQRAEIIHKSAQEANKIQKDYLIDNNMTQQKLNLIFVHNDIKEIKFKIRTIKEMYKNQLENNKEYYSVVNDFNVIKAKKNLIEAKIKEEMSKDFDIINELKKEIKTKETLLSDIAISKLIAGEEINFTDDYDNEYQPVFKVKFVKS